MQLKAIFIAITALLLSSRVAGSDGSKKCLEINYCVNEGEVMCGGHIMGYDAHRLLVCREKCWIELQYCKNGCGFGSWYTTYPEADPNAGSKDPLPHCT